VSRQETVSSIQHLHGPHLVGRGQVGISQGHGQGLMPEELFHRGQVRASHDEMRGEGVPQVVKLEVMYLRAPQSPQEAFLDVPVGFPLGGRKTRRGRRGASRALVKRL
jgi:hypothetical protein